MPAADRAGGSTPRLAVRAAMAMAPAEAALPVKLGAALYYMASSTIVQMSNKVTPESSRQNCS